jgi:hypothetical protein
MQLTIDIKKESSDALRLLVQWYEFKAFECEHLAGAVPEGFEKGLVQSASASRSTAEMIQGELAHRETVQRVVRNRMIEARAKRQKDSGLLTR